jgi:hypothetical protein
MLAGFLRSGLATWNYQTVHAPAARCLKNQHRGVKIIPYCRSQPQTRHNVRVLLSI